MTRLLLTSTLCAILAFSSCSKSDDSSSGSGSTKTRTEYLTTGTWKQTGITINPGITVGGTTITDLYGMIPACSKDDTRKFNVGGTGVDDEGATKCDPADPQTTALTWSLIAGESKLVITSNGETDTTNIISIDGSTFKGTQVMDGSNVGGTPGTQYTLTITATH